MLFARERLRGALAIIHVDDAIHQDLTPHAETTKAKNA